MATLTANVPSLPEHCIHKLPTSCRLTARPICCACQDRRPQSGLYRKYIDGIGFVYQGTRQEHYCWNCMVFWDVRTRESEWPNTSCRIPDEPVQDVFLERWHEFHKWQRESTDRPPEFVDAEPLNLVPIGRLPRTAQELSDGVQLERRIQPLQQRPSDLLAGVSRQDVAEEDRLFDDDETPADLIYEQARADLYTAIENTNAIIRDFHSEARRPDTMPTSEALRTFQSAMQDHSSQRQRDNSQANSQSVLATFGRDGGDPQIDAPTRPPLFRGIETLIQDLKADLSEQPDLPEALTTAINDVLQFLVYAFVETVDDQTISMRGTDGQVIAYVEDAPTGTTALTDLQRNERLLAELDEKVDSIAATHTLARDLRKEVRDKIRAAHTDARRQRLWGTEEQRASDTYESPITEMMANAPNVFRNVFQRQRGQAPATPSPAAPQPSANGDVLPSPGRKALLPILRHGIFRKLEELVKGIDNLRAEDFMRGIDETVPSKGVTTAEKLEDKIAHYQAWAKLLPAIVSAKEYDEMAAGQRTEAFNKAYDLFPDLHTQFAMSRALLQNAHRMDRKITLEGLIPRALASLEPNAAPRQLTTNDFVLAFSDWVRNGSQRLHEANLTREKIPDPLEDHEMNVQMRCAACFEQRANVVFIPCGHIAFCKWCCEVVFPCAKYDRTRISDATAKCPVCRKSIRNKHEVFVLGGQSDKKEENGLIEKGESSVVKILDGLTKPASVVN